MLRLLFIGSFFLLSLLCAFPAPTLILWYVAILVTEFPWIFVGVASTLVIWSLTGGKYTTPALFVSLVTLGFFLSPIIRAYNVGANLDRDFDLSFGLRSTKLNDDDHKAPFSFWSMLAGINSRQTPYETLIYRKVDQNTLTLDYYKSESTQKSPCVVIVHGGSWSSGDSRQLPELNSYLAKKGYNIASINYRLAPHYLSPAPVKDLHAAIAYLRLHSGDLNIDTGNFVLLGRSAGGQIVLSEAYTVPEPGLKGVVSYYGPTDMVWGYANPANPWVYNSCKVMEDYFGASYSKVPDQYILGSATSTLTKYAVPTLLIHGQNDVLVAYEHSIRLERKMAENGVKGFLLTLPWATHGCDYTLNGPSGQLATYAVERFLRHVTK